MLSLVPCVISNRSLSNTIRSFSRSFLSSDGVWKDLYEALSSSRSRLKSSSSRGSRSGAGDLMYMSFGFSPESSYSSSKPETLSPGATHP